MQSQLSESPIDEKMASLRYKELQLNGSTPLNLLLQVYEYGIVGCLKRDEKQVSAALVELIDALNFEQEEIAAGLFKLYDYCLRIVKKGNYDEVLTIITELRDTWTKVAGLNNREKSVA